MVLFNTKHSPAPKEQLECKAGIVTPPNTALFMPLDEMSKDTILYVNRFREFNEVYEFATRYGVHKEDTTLSEALWLCSRLIMRCDYKIQNTEIVLFTNDPRPMATSSTAHNQCLVRAGDMIDLGVHLWCVPTAAGDRFDYEPIYKSLLCKVNEIDADDWIEPPPPAQVRSDLLTSRSRTVRRLCLRYFQLTLADGVAISCGLYPLTQSAPKPKSVHVLRDTNEVVVSKRHYVVADATPGATAATEDDLDNEGGVVYVPVLPSALRKYQKVGGQKIMFSIDEHAALKSIIMPGMRVLGFKPLSALPQHWLVKCVRFMYPNEQHVKGSAKLFRALWERCMAVDQFVLCSFVQMRKTKPR